MSKLIYTGALSTMRFTRAARHSLAQSLGRKTKNRKSAKIRDHRGKRKKRFALDAVLLRHDDDDDDDDMPGDGTEKLNKYYLFDRIRFNGERKKIRKIKIK